MGYQEEILVLSPAGNNGAATDTKKCAIPLTGLLGDITVVNTSGANATVSIQEVTGAQRVFWTYEGAQTATLIPHCDIIRTSANMVVFYGPFTLISAGLQVVVTNANPGTATIKVFIRTRPSE